MYMCVCMVCVVCARVFLNVWVDSGQWKCEGGGLVDILEIDRV